jgi:hypothetical protein
MTRAVMPRSRIPGASTPTQCPIIAVTIGSLCVIQRVTRSPSRSNISAP